MAIFNFKSFVGNRSLNRDCVKRLFSVYILFPLFTWILRLFIMLWLKQLKFSFFLTWCSCMHLSILSRPSKIGNLKCTIPVSSVQQTTSIFVINSQRRDEREKRRTRPFPSHVYLWYHRPTCCIPILTRHLAN